MVDITVTAQGYDAPDSIPGGLTGIRLHNARTEDHDVVLGRLKDGVTFEQYLATEDSGSVATVAGGVNSIGPGGTAEVVLDLEPGRYVLVDLSFSPVAPSELEVTAAPDPQPSKPEAQATVRMSEFAFEAPRALPAGMTTAEVVNDGQQAHWMEVRRVNEEGLTADQVQQRLSGTAVSYDGVLRISMEFGGMGELAPGDSGWAMLDLSPGVYVLLCNAGGHFQRGMYHVFTVQ